MTIQNFSFVIPAYNDAKGLARHLDYFRARPEPIQLVIVDDCSQDETPEVIRTAAMPGNIDITYHRLATNSGPAIARNIGIDLADRDYLMFLDADDILADCFFDYIRLTPLENGVDFVLFKYHLVTTTGGRYSYDMHHGDRAFFSAWESGFPLPVFRLDQRPHALGTVNYPWNKIYRRAFLLSAKIRFPDLRMHEDITPHWQSFLRCRSFGVLNWAPPLITHFEIPDSGRATNYLGQQRLEVFGELPRVFAEVQTHPHAETIVPVFHEFCDQLFHWMTEVLCAGQDAQSQEWQQRYKDKIAQVRRTVGYEGPAR